jgi:hypothetical protein
VTTAQIYKGSIAFIVLQLIMVAVIVMNPGIVTGNLDQATKVDDATVMDMLNNVPGGEDSPAPDMSGSGLPEAEAPAGEIDPAKALEDAIKKAE